LRVVKVKEGNNLKDLFKKINSHLKKIKKGREGNNHISKKKNNLEIAKRLKRKENISEFFNKKIV